MPFNQQTFDDALEKNDKALAASLCDEFIKDFFQNPDSLTVAQLEKMMLDLRRKRMFKSMQKLGDASMQVSKTSFKIRRQFAQSLIEEGLFTAALNILTDLITETESLSEAGAAFENKESYGLVGRANKQLYVTAGNSQHLSCHNFMEKSLLAYWSIYEKDRSENIWHGINTVAMAARAEADGMTLSKTVNVAEIATSILQVVENKLANEKAFPYDLATAMEACVALRQPKKALEWVNEYIKMPQTDAFEIASTLRQLTEVWRLEKDNSGLQQIIPVLRGALLKKEGGALTIDAAEIRDGVFNKDVVTLKPEKVFGSESYQSYEWYLKGAKRCFLIARIGREKTKGFGTGFLMKGSDFHPDLADEMVLLTNAHVVTNDQNEREALRPEEALILFEVLGIQKTYSISELFFTSPYKELDVTILRFSEKDGDELKNTLKEKGVEMLNLSNKVLQKDGSERMYIIGHPAGGTLQLSLQDNALLDFEDRLLHYRTPTVGGSSGSPVFDDNWNLVGIHHAGGNYIQKLNNVRGMYQANEGIRITSIIEALKNK